MQEAAVAGTCDARFAPVRDAFRNNFAALGEHGAAVSVYVDGRKVVDLWGGWANEARTAHWAEDSLVNVYSVGKGIAVLGVLSCIERGAIDLDRPIAQTWRGFAQAGKAEITLRQVLSHRAGLPAIAEPLPLGAAVDWPRMIGALERQAPWWEPGSKHGYHVNTYGYLVGQCVRATNTQTLGQLLAERICGPLAADVYLGLPETLHARAVEFAFPATTVLELLPPNVSDAERMRWNAYSNPPDISGRGVINTAAWRSAELASTNMHASARGIARLYAALAAGGVLEGVRIADTQLLAEATREHSVGVDFVLERPSRFALGFQLTQPERPLGPNAGAFGHHGAGGSLGFCDPEVGLGFGYVMNTLGPRWQNPRNRALIEAVYACL
ncbi:MAG TPA: serine hydrolase domain-containing protein [Polyangiales bacterium]|nr:serine hydrolase domain-containing protein [Polyangiales bacterium]